MRKCLICNNPLSDHNLTDTCYHHDNEPDYDPIGDDIRFESTCKSYVNSIWAKTIQDYYGDAPDSY